VLRLYFKYKIHLYIINMWISNTYIWNTAHHCAHLPSTVLDSSVLLTCYATTTSDIMPGPGWHRPSSKWNITWLDQICTDLNLLASNSLQLATDCSTVTTAPALSTAYHEYISINFHKPKVINELNDHP